MAIAFEFGIAIAQDVFRFIRIGDWVCRVYSSLRSLVTESWNSEANVV